MKYFEDMTRGERNNNPLNIRHSSSRWQGRCLVQTDKDFVQFKNVVFGIRAAFILFRTYVYKYKCDCVTSIIKRWAPESDGNNTRAYIAFIQTRLYQEMEKSIKESHPVITPSDISFLKLYSDPNLSRCFFTNRQTPSAFCIEVLKYMAEIESKMQLSDKDIQEAIKLL